MLKTSTQQVVKQPGTRVAMTTNQAASARFIEYSPDRRYAVVATLDNQPEEWETVSHFETEDGEWFECVVYFWVCAQKPNGHYIPMYFAHTSEEDAADFFDMICADIPQQLRLF